MFKKILIANRGEIACRIIRTARRMGIATVAVYSEADARRAARPRGGRGGADRPAAVARELSARSTGSSRLPRDRRRGDPSRAMASCPSARPSPRRWRRPASSSSARPPRRSRRWATRSRAKRLASAAGVTTVPGYLGAIADAAEARHRSPREIGYPVMIKAAAGGGGKGMRIAHGDAEVARGLRARALARRARRFGDDRVFLEKFIVRAAPHRDPGAGRPARQRRPSRRARMLDPAPPPEGDRGGAVAVPRRGDAPGDGRAGGRARARRRLPLAPAPSSSSSSQDATSTSSR